MPQDPDQPRRYDPAIQTDDLAFDPSELIKCSCGRFNPPNRSKCLYCGVAIAISGDNLRDIRLNLGKLEPWEPGWNVILLNGNEVSSKAAEIARAIGSEPTDIALITMGGIPLPIARVKSESEAKLLTDRLASLGAAGRVVPDRTLNAEKPPTRLRAIELRGRTLILIDFNTGAEITLPVNDLALIVPGLIFSTRTDALEKRRRRTKQVKVLDEISSTNDESILDIYGRSDPGGYRVHMAGFDFSCLGPEKGLLASENIRALAVMLRDYAPTARTISIYPQVRHAMDSIWPVEGRKDAKGLQRAGFGKVEFGSTVSTSNAVQFTKFSRLQWHLL